MARCRRNVDNFLEACRKIGVDEVCFVLLTQQQTYTVIVNL